MDKDDNVKPNDLTLMDGYYLRVYRRSEQAGNKRRITDGVQLVGILQSSTDGNKTVFRNLEELWSLLGKQ